MTLRGDTSNPKSVDLMGGLYRNQHNETQNRYFIVSSYSRTTSVSLRNLALFWQLLLANLWSLSLVEVPQYSSCFYLLYSSYALFLSFYNHYVWALIINEKWGVMTVIHSTARWSTPSQHASSREQPNNNGTRKHSFITFRKRLVVVVLCSSHFFFCQSCCSIPQVVVDFFHRRCPLLEGSYHINDPWFHLYTSLALIWWLIVCNAHIIKS